MAVPAQGCAEIDLDAEKFSPARVDCLPEKEYYELRGKNLACRVDRSGQLVSVKRTGSEREFLSARL